MERYTLDDMVEADMILGGTIMMLMGVLARLARRNLNFKSSTDHEQFDIEEVRIVTTACSFRLVPGFNTPLVVSVLDNTVVIDAAWADGAPDGLEDGCELGDLNGCAVGYDVGLSIGCKDGLEDGSTLGCADGCIDGCTLGCDDGIILG